MKHTKEYQKNLELKINKIKGLVLLFIFVVCPLCSWFSDKLFYISITVLSLLFMYWCFLEKDIIYPTRFD